jgi:predicted aminopeptidase
MAGFSLLGVALAATALVCLGSGCSTLSYYSQSVAGHVDLMTRAKPVDTWLADSAIPAQLQQRLELSQRMREFSVATLKLPDNASYRSYADLKRPAAVWNVVAAPQLSLKLKTWCYPVTGCVGYRGSCCGGDNRCGACRADDGTARCGPRSLHQQCGSHARCEIEG